LQLRLLEDGCNLLNHYVVKVINAYLTTKGLCYDANIIVWPT